MKVEIGGVWDTVTRQWLDGVVLVEEKIPGGWSISIEEHGIRRCESRGQDKGTSILNCLMKYEEEGFR